MITRSGKKSYQIELTLDPLVRHFATAAPGDMIGLHATVLEENCRRLGVDIDRHEGDGLAPRAIACSPARYGTWPIGQAPTYA